MDIITFEDLKTFMESSSWDKYKKKFPEKSIWLQQVMKRVGLSYFPDKKFKFSYLSDGMCDVVVAAVVAESVIQDVSYRFKWFGVKHGSVNHFLLFDIDSNLFIDLTAIQFSYVDKKPTNQVLVFEFKDFNDLGYTFHPNQVLCQKVIRETMNEYLSKTI